jgi:hypothetical protein
MERRMEKTKALKEIRKHVVEAHDKLLELQDADICEEPVLDFLLESALTKLDEELGDDEAA